MAEDLLDAARRLSELSLTDWASFASVLGLFISIVVLVRVRSIDLPP